MKRFFNKLIWVAGLFITTLLNASLVQAQTTVDLGTHQPATAAPTGSVFEWHNALPISAGNLMSAAQIAAAGQGVYYGVYHFTSENCYGSATPLRVIAPVCPATTVDIRTLADSSLKPFGTIVTWHANAPPSSASRMTVSAAMNAASGSTYYTAYYDPIADCYSAYSPIVVLNNPCTVCSAPFLILQNAVCNGSTYSVTFNSNGTVTASAGTVSGSIITGIPTGTNVAFSASAGATVTASAGTVSGSTIINIPIASNVSITAANGSCTASITVNHPADCSMPCATPGASFSAGICNGTTYSINIANPNSATITVSAGTVTATAITGIPIGTNVTITATATGCTAQVVTISSPTVMAPLLAAQSPVCNGTTYNVTFNSNGIVTVNAGTISGNMVTGIPVGTNLVLTASSVNGCATTVVTVVSPTTCNPACIAPVLTTGQGVCSGNGFYSVAFGSTAGATITASAGVVFGNTVFNIPVASNVTITAAFGTCSTSIIVGHPADCSTPCVSTPASFSGGICNGNTYSVFVSNPNGSTITASAGNVSSGAITGIPIGTDVIITATATGCTPQVVVITSPAICTQPDFTPLVDIDGITTSSTGRAFVVNINNLTNNPNIGQLVFRIRKVAGFAITYDPTAVTANVFGGEPVNNSDWVFSETTSFITVTLKAGKSIPGSQNSAIGFAIAPIAGTPKNTSQTITVTITNGSGGDSNSLNNTAVTSIISQ